MWVRQGSLFFWGTSYVSILPIIEPLISTHSCNIGKMNEAWILWSRIATSFSVNTGYSGSGSIASEPSTLCLVCLSLKYWAIHPEDHAMRLSDHVKNSFCPKEQYSHSFTPEFSRNSRTQSGSQFDFYFIRDFISWVWTKLISLKYFLKHTYFICFILIFTVKSRQKY